MVRICVRSAGEDPDTLAAARVLVPISEKGRRAGAVRTWSGFGQELVRTREDSFLRGLCELGEDRGEDCGEEDDKAHLAGDGAGGGGEEGRRKTGSELGR
jgi:hypothetical protein